jgi:hypothetical protein
LLGNTVAVPVVEFVTSRIAKIISSQSLNH